MKPPFIIQCLTLSSIFIFCPETKAAGPFQSWLMIGVSQRLDYSLEANVEWENHWSEKKPAWRQSQVEPSLTWHYSPRYDFGVGYMWTEDWPEQNMNDSMHEGLFFGTIKADLKNWMLTSRQRFQFGEMDDETTGMFRQKTRAEYRAEWLPFRIRPFATDEWFLDLMDGYVSENRFYGGLSYAINRAWMVEIYGMRLDLWGLNGEHRSGPVFGMEVKLSF
ncbi:MAG: DUF2490 domain-containing protein [bacterium]